MPTCRWSSSRSRSRIRRSGPASARPRAARVRGRNGFNMVANALDGAGARDHRPLSRGVRGASAPVRCSASPASSSWRRPTRRRYHRPARLSALAQALPSSLSTARHEPPRGGDRPPQFDQIKDGGRGIAGSPATVTRMIRSQMEEAGTELFRRPVRVRRSHIDGSAAHDRLFAREVMPALGNGGSHEGESRVSIR